MKKIKTIVGITWALLCLLLIIILFPGLNSFSSSAARLPFMKINPYFSGGEVAKQLISHACTLDIRKPVFDGLFKERESGFVQIDWRGDIPDTFKDTIDYDLDGIPDFCITVDRSASKAELDPFNTKVKYVSISTPTSYGWAARIALRK
jgi:hypothetical protein